MNLPKMFEGGLDAVFFSVYVRQATEAQSPDVFTAAGYERACGSAATVADFIDHIDYAVKLIGIDHVGIASDFEGGGGVRGWDDASETFNVTLELVRRGYTEEQIEKLWGRQFVAGDG